MLDQPKPNQNISFKINTIVIIFNKKEKQSVKKLLDIYKNRLKKRTINGYQVFIYKNTYCGEMATSVLKAAQALYYT